MSLAPHARNPTLLQSGPMLSGCCGVCEAISLLNYDRFIHYHSVTANTLLLMGVFVRLTRALR